MEHIGRIELTTPRRYHNHMEDVTRPHQNLVDFLDQNSSLHSLEFMHMKTDLKIVTKRKAAVVYHISRNGHLEHPHFLEVPVSSFKGLYLKDVISALNSIRGPGMANLYSCRSHGKGFVWKDLSEKDLIQPYNDDEQYILKGSPVPENSPWNLTFPDDILTSSTSKHTSASSSSLTDEFDSPVIRGKSFRRTETDNEKPHRTSSMEIKELDSGFSTPRNDGTAKNGDAGKEVQHNYQETLRSAMFRTDRTISSPSTTPPKPIARRVGRARTAGLLRTLVTCGSKFIR
ncbi:Protein SOSEKI 5 [Linum grandiflorum]